MNREGVLPVRLFTGRAFFAFTVVLYEFLGQICESLKWDWKYMVG